MWGAGAGGYCPDMAENADVDEHDDLRAPPGPGPADPGPIDPREQPAAGGTADDEPLQGEGEPDSH